MAGRALPGPVAAVPDEPVWLVRIVLLLFFAAFAAFLAWDVYWWARSW